jgi:hypothetical protein
MSPPAPRHYLPPTGPAARWEAIRYALDSNARTIRLCTILLAASFPPGVIIILLLHR